MPAPDALQDRAGAPRELSELVEDCRRLPGFYGAPIAKIEGYLLEKLRRGEVIARGRFGVFPPCAWADVWGRLVERYEELSGFGGMRFDDVQDFHRLLSESESIEADLAALRRRVGDDLVVKLRRGELIATRDDSEVPTGGWDGIRGEEFLAEFGPETLIRSGRQNEIRDLSQTIIANTGRQAWIVQATPGKAPKNKGGRKRNKGNDELVLEVVEKIERGMGVKEAVHSVIKDWNTKSENAQSIFDMIDDRARKLMKQRAAQREKNWIYP